MITPDEFYETRQRVMQTRKEQIERRVTNALRGKAGDSAENEPFLISVYDHHYDWNRPYTNDEIQYIKELLTNSGWYVYPGVHDLKHGRIYIRVQSEPIMRDREVARRGFWSKLFNK